MASQSAGNGKSGFFRQLLNAQYDAYMKIAVRKHGLSTDMLHRKASELSDEELASAVASLRDLAHLPPE
jgi:hypothetical protein